MYLPSFRLPQPVKLSLTGCGCGDSFYIGHGADFYNGVSGAGFGAAFCSWRGNGWGDGFGLGEASIAGKGYGKYPVKTLLGDCYAAA